MPIIRRSNRNGHAAAATLPAAPVAATSYAMTESATSGATNSPVTLTFAPVGGVWPVASIGIAISGVSDTLANGAGGTLSGTTLSVPSGTSTNCTVIMTPTTGGATATISATNNAGMTNPNPIDYTVNASGGGGTYSPLSDLTWTQVEPYSTVLQNNGDNFKPVVGTFAPVGGTGPFKYSVDNAVFVAWNVPQDGTLYRSVTTSPYGWLIGPGGSPQDTTSSVTLRITDATGATVSKTVTITRASAAAEIFANGNRHWTDTVMPSVSVATFAADGTMADVTGGNLTLADPSGLFQIAYGAISTKSFGPAPVGSYPMTVSSSGFADKSITITVTSGAIAGPVVFTPKLASSSMPAGTVVGQLACTTPANLPTWSITDATHTLAVSTSGQIVLAVDQPPAATYTFTATATEGSQSRSDSVSLTVVQGTVLPATNMTMTVASGLLNDRKGQSIGSPSVTGVTGTPSWVITHQTYYNEATTEGQYGIPAPIAINSTTGAVTAPGYLSADPDGSSVGSGTVTISCSDGINTCTQTFAVPVAWAPSTTYYVGTGMSTAHPGVGYETLNAAYAGTGANAAHTGTLHFLVYADSSADKYVGDFGTYLTGPIIIEGVAANGAAQPRLGGAHTNNTESGENTLGKGCLLISHGDAVIKNVEMAYVHGTYANTYSGPEGIRKDGNTYGNLLVQNCYIHDCDNGLLTGFGHGELVVDTCEFANCGTNHNGAGPCHNMYLGEMTKVTVRYTKSRRSTYGHLCKIRAMQSIVHDCEFFDGVTGNGGHVINLPFLGQSEIYNNKLSKGPMASNPDLLRCGEDGGNPQYGGATWQTNTLSFHDNQVELLAQPGNHYGTPCVVGFYMFTNKLGVSPTISMTNNSILFAPGTVDHKTYNQASATITDPTGVWTISGTTTRTTPVAFTTTRPFLSGSLPTSGPLYRNTRYGDDSFANFDGVYQWQDKDLLDLATGTSSGTVCTMWASNDLGAQGSGTANPFGAGTTWAIITDAMYYPEFNATPWAASGKYSVTTNADGSASLHVASALTAGVDYVQIRATAPNGTKCDCRYPVIVS